jgi:hypothetical protein
MNTSFLSALILAGIFATTTAAPSLFHADWVHPIADTCPKLQAYRSRLLAWPSFGRSTRRDRIGRTLRWVPRTGIDVHRQGFQPPRRQHAPMQTK